MDFLRNKAGKPDLPVWFVFFGKNYTKAKTTAKSADTYKNMFVTISTAGEYGNAITVDP